MQLHWRIRSISLLYCIEWPDFLWFDQILNLCLFSNDNLAWILKIKSLVFRLPHCLMRIWVKYTLTTHTVIFKNISTHLLLMWRMTQDEIFLLKIKYIHESNLCLNDVTHNHRWRAKIKNLQNLYGKVIIFPGIGNFIMSHFWATMNMIQRIPRLLSLYKLMRVNSE